MISRETGCCNMGGPGSGYFSWRRLPRNLVERAFVLDLAALRRIRGAANGVASGQLKLVARATGEALHLGYVAIFTDPANPYLHLIFQAAGKPQEQVISLDATTPRYGGIRYWFLCPDHRRAHALSLSNARSRCVRITGRPWPELSKPIRERLLAQRAAGAEDPGSARGRSIDLLPLPSPAAWDAQTALQAPQRGGRGRGRRLLDTKDQTRPMNQRPWRARLPT